MPGPKLRARTQADKDRDAQAFGPKIASEGHGGAMLRRAPAQNMSEVKSFPEFWELLMSNPITGLMAGAAGAAVPFKGAAPLPTGGATLKLPPKLDTAGVQKTAFDDYLKKIADILGVVDPGSSPGVQGSILQRRSGGMKAQREVNRAQMQETPFEKATNMLQDLYPRLMGNVGVRPTVTKPSENRNIIGTQHGAFKADTTSNKMGFGDIELATNTYLDPAFLAGHEATHAAQRGLKGPKRFDQDYVRLLKEHGYDNHPMEASANASGSKIQTLVERYEEGQPFLPQIKRNARRMHADRSRHDAQLEFERQDLDAKSIGSDRAQVMSGRDSAAADRSKQLELILSTPDDHGLPEAIRRALGQPEFMPAHPSLPPEFQKRVDRDPDRPIFSVIPKSQRERDLEDFFGKKRGGGK